MTVRPLYPEVRPTLDLNFAKTKKLDPRITYSRASAGTFVGSDGLIQSAGINVPRFDHNPVNGESLGLLVEEARTNLITYSEYFTGWSFTSAFGTTRFTIIPDQYVSPNNTINGDFIRETTANGPGYYQRTLSISAGSYFSISCYVYGVGNYASNTTRRVILGLFPTSSGSSVDGYTVAFNLFSSTVTSSRLGRPVWNGGTGTSAVFTETGSKITNVGNGWRKIEVYGKCSVANPIIIFTTLNRELNSGDNDGGGAFTMTGDGSSGIGVWGFQAEAGSFPTSYIPTPATFTGRTSTATFFDSAGVLQTAASGVARSNAFFPDSSGTFRPAGLLLEAAATNQALYSEQLDNPAWTKASVTISGNVTTAPDGTSTADKIVEDTSTGAHFIYPDAITLPTGAVTVSCFAKADGRRYLSLSPTDLSDWWIFGALFDLQTGVVTATLGSVNASIVPVGNGWYRCSATTTVTTGGTGANARFSIGLQANGTLGSSDWSYTGNGTSGIFVWGVQLEAGAYASSYIPTTAATVTRAADTSTSATVTRSADAVTIGGANFSSWYRNSSSTFAIRGRLVSTPIGQNTWGILAVSIPDLHADNNFRMRISGTQFAAKRFDNGVNYEFNLPGSVTAGSTYNYAVGYDDTGHAASSPLGLSATTYPALPFQNSTILKFVPDLYGASHIISRLTYWPVRLPDSVLRGLTTL